MEGPQGQLRSGLANGLCRNNPHRGTDTDHIAATQIAPVAQRANAVYQITGQWAADFYLLNARVLDCRRDFVVDDFVAAYYQFVTFEVK